MSELTKDLLQLERLYWLALQDKDVAAAKRLTDFPCILTGPHGVGQIAEPAFTKMMEDAQHSIVSFELGEQAEVRQLTSDVAVLAYVVHEDLLVDGEPVVVDAAESSTWVRRGGRWRCAHHTEAILGDPFGRDHEVSKS